MKAAEVAYYQLLAKLDAAKADYTHARLEIAALADEQPEHNDVWRLCKCLLDMNPAFAD